MSIAPTIPIFNVSLLEQQQILDEFEDMQLALKTADEHPQRGGLWSRLGPGLITGAADNDPAGIGTYSVVGAHYGYGMLWLLPICLPLMIAIQEMCGRLAAVTGRGLAAVIANHYSRRALWGVVLLLLGANCINVWADLNVMAACAQMLTGWPLQLWLVVIAGGTLLAMILVPYRNYVNFLKWMSVAMVAYVACAFMPGVRLHWGEIVSGLQPHWFGGKDFTSLAMAFLGTSISPYLFFWQAGETVEERVAEGKALAPGVPIHRPNEADIRRLRSDTVVGMVFAQVISFCVILCTAGTLFAHGIHTVDTAQDAAKALLPLGPAAGYLFTAAIIGAGLLVIPTLAGSVAYALAETCGWRYGLYRPFRRAPQFYLALSAVIVIGALLNFVAPVSPIDGLLYASILNGLVAPPLIVVLLLLCNNRRVMRGRRNGWVSNVLGATAVVLMTATSVGLFLTM